MDNDLGAEVTAQPAPSPIEEARRLNDWAREAFDKAFSKTQEADYDGIPPEPFDFFMWGASLRQQFIADARALSDARLAALVEAAQAYLDAGSRLTHTAISPYSIKPWRDAEERLLTLLAEAEGRAALPGE